MSSANITVKGDDICGLFHKVLLEKARALAQNMCLDGSITMWESEEEKKWLATFKVSS